jgi:predicted RNA-binding protein with PIN domain
MPTIIDGNNLIGSSPDISLGDPLAREKMLQLIKNYQKNKNTNLIIVFDGKPDSIYHDQSSEEKLSVVYPGFGYSADDEIKKILSGYSDYKTVTLVSSDRELKDYAKKMGAKTINSIEFYFELKKVYRISGNRQEKLKRIHGTISKQEVEKWMKIFDND